MPYRPPSARYFAAAAASRAARSALVAGGRMITSAVGRTRYRTGPYVKTSNRKFRRAVDRVINSRKETMFLDFAFGKSSYFIIIGHRERVLFR